MSVEADGQGFVTFAAGGLDEVEIIAPRDDVFDHRLGLIIEMANRHFGWERRLNLDHQPVALGKRLSRILKNFLRHKSRPDLDRRLMPSRY